MAKFIDLDGMFVNLSNVNTIRALDERRENWSVEFGDGTRITMEDVSEEMISYILKSTKGQP